MYRKDVELDTSILYHGIYQGVVEDNSDPLNQGRVRVRILGFHSPDKTFNGQDGLSITDLPWAIPANPIQGGSISGIGWSGVPVLGSHVCLFFLGGDHNYPVYFATIPSIYKTKPDSTKGFSDPTGKYPLAVNTPDFNALASKTNTVFETPDDGVRVEYDSTPGSEKYKVTLKAANSTLTMSQDGKVEIISSQESGGLQITVKGNANIVSDGKCIVQGKGTVEIVGANTSATLDGIITGKSVCHFTGQPHADKSVDVKCTKAG